MSLVNSECISLIVLIKHMKNLALGDGLDGNDMCKVFVKLLWEDKKMEVITNMQFLRIFNEHGERNCGG